MPSASPYVGDILYDAVLYADYDLLGAYVGRFHSQDSGAVGGCGVFEEGYVEFICTDFTLGQRGLGAGRLGFLLWRFRGRIAVGA